MQNLIRLATSSARWLTIALVEILKALIVLLIFCVHHVTEDVKKGHKDEPSYSIPDWSAGAAQLPAPINPTAE